MKIRTRCHSSFAVLSFLSLAFLPLPCDVQSKPITETAKVGAYFVTLKVLPAESFAGSKARWSG